MRKPVLGFPTRSDTNWAVQRQKIARSLKFRIYAEEGFYYLCSKNKSADQLLHSLAVSLFSHMQKATFLMMRLIFTTSLTSNIGNSGWLVHKYFRNDLGVLLFEQVR